MTATDRAKEALAEALAEHHGAGWFPSTECVCIIGSLDECVDRILATPAMQPILAVVRLSEPVHDALAAWSHYFDADPDARHHHWTALCRAMDALHEAYHYPAAALSARPQEEQG